MAGDSRIEKIKLKIDEFPDFPKPGILFRDIFSVLQDPPTFKLLIDVMIEHVKKFPDVEVIVGLESRGFLFGPSISQALNIPFVPVRKRGKLPGEVASVEYSLEYGKDVIEVQKRAIKPGQKVVIVDDLLATGGTMKAAFDLMATVQAEVLEGFVIIELCDLNGKSKSSKPITSLIQL